MSYLTIHDFKHDSPRFYHQKGADSDRDKIMACMKYIPEDKQQAVSLKYERIFNNKNLPPNERRENANNWLGETAREYRQEWINESSRKATES